MTCDEDPPINDPYAQAVMHKALTGEWPKNFYLDRAGNPLWGTGELHPPATDEEEDPS